MHKCKESSIDPSLSCVNDGFAGCGAAEAGQNGDRSSKGLRKPHIASARAEEKTLVLVKGNDAQAPLPFAERAGNFEATKVRSRMMMTKYNTAHRPVQFYRRVAEWDGLPNGA
ncbi:hypothetical protein LRP31_09615 [Mesorhizobium mediterraneum]|uniref:hypothetical protein n=1 Tax=Mesorhizobium TaxID=68287 RepID=UPI000FCA777B|nr:MULTISPECIES: hypothetical protein [Mesorhizobium]RUU26726.1 hypothetical protein EOC94_26015 [Mesorhizobium sp. M6A.T.Ce.TU.016.01.1.1]RWN28024.1 MAG: hypothetical protein EOR96_32970 [Mesorhizobium sp.]RWQ35464.1 MAG: hypothetical protein EOS21_25860 [Mesorhizobium sp.]RWQ62847.1 MAG: hypothetical protein EOS86_27770 [Mesorhizobium sp.]TIT26282.1 MAG: hypothetical protein E5W78_20360 [Mesorhizobium sp.]